MAGFRCGRRRRVRHRGARLRRRATRYGVRAEGRVEAVVYAGDGEMISRWGPALEAADVPSTMVVGVHRHADEETRLHEYSPGFDPQRFTAHENFFVNDVRELGRGTVRSRPAVRAHRSVRGVCRGRAGTRSRTAASRRLRRDPRRLAGCRLPTTRADAATRSAHVPGGRHTSRSSSRTPRDGRQRCEMPAPTSS